MNDLKHGYYWISYRGHEPIIWEFDGTWMACGNEQAEFDLGDGYKIVGKVSEWSSDEKEKALHKHGVTNRIFVGLVLNIVYFIGIIGTYFTWCAEGNFTDWGWWVKLIIFAILINAPIKTIHIPTKIPTMSVIKY